MIKLKINDEVVEINDDLETASKNEIVLTVLDYVGKLTPDKGYPELIAVELFEKFGAKIIDYPKVKEGNKVY